MLGQKFLLQRFRREYPDLTFKEIAKKTGINTTRVFRLFNGQEMKLSEYQLLDKLLDKNPIEEKAELCSRELPKEQLEKISDIMERYLDSYLLTHDAKGYYSRQQARRVS